jgi:hypothetical protein
MQTNNKKLLDRYFKEEAPKPVPKPIPQPVVVTEKSTDNSTVIIKLMNIIATLEMQLIDIKLRDQSPIPQDAIATIQRDETGKMATISITHKK